MGVPGWSRTPAQNAVADPGVAAADGASSRTTPAALRAVMAAMRRQADDQGGAIVTAGDLNAYRAATGSGVGELRPGIALLVKVHRSNTASPTLNVDGLGPLPWVDAGGVPLTAGRLLKDRFYATILDTLADGSAVAWRVQAGASTLSEIPGLEALQADVALKAAATAASADTASAAATTATARAAETETARAQVASNALAVAGSATQVAADRTASQQAVSITQAAATQAQNAVGSARVRYALQSQLFANLAPAPGAVGEVYDDPDATKIGTYAKVGASGAGSWSQTSTLTLESVNARIPGAVKRGTTDNYLLKDLVLQQGTNREILKFGLDRDGCAVSQVDGVERQLAAKPIRVKPGGYISNQPLFNDNDGVARYFERDPRRLDLVFMSGQSLSIGQTTTVNSPDLPADATARAAYDAEYFAPLTTTPPAPGTGLMFNVGVRPNGRAVTGFVDLVEQYYDNGGATPSGETQCSRAVGSYLDRMGSALGFKQPTAIACIGQGSSTYPNFMRGTSFYDEALRLTRAAMDIVRAGTRFDRVRVLLIDVTHGESDSSATRGPTGALITGTDRETYRDQTRMYFRQLREDIRRITGQTEDIVGFINQVNRGSNDKNWSPKIPVAQLDVHGTENNVCTGPIYYYFDNRIDGVHPTKYGYAAIGEHKGYAWFEQICGRGFQPIRMVEASFTDATQTKIRARFNDPVTLDTTDSLVNVSRLGAGLGFDFVDGATVPPAITGVALVTGTSDTVEITLANAPVGPRRRLNYALRYNTNRGGSNDGARGAVRSPTSFGSAPYVQPLSNNGVQYGAVSYPSPFPLYRWACPQQIAVN